MTPFGDPPRMSDAKDGRTMAEPKPLRAMICDGDVWIRRTLGTIAEEAGFEVIAEAANVIGALREISYVQPTLVVITFDSLAMNPLSILSELNHPGGDRMIVLVSQDLSTEERAHDAGVFAVAPQGDANRLEEILTAAAERLRSGDRSSFVDRRTRAERRQTQDWSKVTMQRRGSDGRREIDVADDADGPDAP